MDNFITAFLYSASARPGLKQVFLPARFGQSVLVDKSWLTFEASHKEQVYSRLVLGLAKFKLLLN
jgi:hypothetical protein